MSRELSQSPAAIRKRRERENFALAQAAEWVDVHDDVYTALSYLGWYELGEGNGEKCRAALSRAIHDWAKIKCPFIT